jgi:hypothetical protein
MRSAPVEHESGFARRVTPELTPQKEMQLLTAAPGSAERKSVAWLACAALISVSAQMSAAQGLRLDKESPFSRELRAEPLPQDPAELLVKAQLFNRGQAGADGMDLAHWLDRTRILDLLGEPTPAPLPHTIGEAIAIERSSPESFDQLRRRAMDSVLTVERATDSKSDDFQYSGRIAYLGNSVWQGGATNRRVWIRVKVTNHSSRPIDLFGITHEADRGRALDFSRCTLQGGGSLAAQATRYAICLDEVDIDKTPLAMRAIAADILVPPLRVARIEMADIRLVEHGDTLPVNSGWVSNANRTAGEILAQLPCERLSSCAQIAQHKAEEAQREYWHSPEYLAKQRAKRLERGSIKLNLGFALMLILTVGFAAIPARAEEPVEGWAASVAAGATVVVGILVVMCARALVIESPLAQGYGGYLVAIAGMGAAAVVGILLVWLGLALRDRARRTRLRLAALGFGLGSLGMFASIFVQ